MGQPWGISPEAGASARVPEKQVPAAIRASEMMDGAFPRLTFSRCLRRHHVKGDRVTCRSGIVLLQKPFDVTSAHRGELALADLADVRRRDRTVFWPFMVLPRLELPPGYSPYSLMGCV